jgi:hypothetical protein
VSWDVLFDAVRNAGSGADEPDGGREIGHGVGVRWPVDFVSKGCQ